jgi:hypothetical protein
MRRPPVVQLILLGVPALLFGQAENTSTSNRPGAAFRLEGVSVYGGYYTTGTPVGFEIPTQSPFLGPTAMVGTTVTLGGSRSREKSDITWSYSPSYFTTVYSSQNERRHGSLNHRFGMNWRRKLGNKWTVSSSANGFLASLEQLYFAPGTLSSVAAFPTSFDNLAAAMLAGKFTDAQLAALLTGSNLQASPEQAFPYGNRLLNASANLGLAWAPSGRTTISTTLTGTRTQHVSGAGVTGPNVGRGSLLPQMTTAAGTIAWTYSLSPRTQVSVQATSNRTFSKVQQGYASSTQLSVGRTLSRRWFAQLRGGAGAITYSRQLYGKPKTMQHLYGGSLGFKTTSHTFLAAYDRSLGDVYGFGSGATGTGTGAWNWRRLGSGWSMSASASYQQLDNSTFSNTTSWRTSAALSRSFGRQVSMNCQYVYFQLPMDISTPGMEREQSGVIVSLSWAPRRYQ